MDNQISIRNSESYVEDREGNWQIEVANNLARVQELRHSWVDLPSNIEPAPIDVDIDWYICTMKSIDAAPHVLIIWRNGKVEAIIAGRLHQRKMSPRLGYLRLWASVFQCWSIHYGCILALPGDGLDKVLCKAILSQLRHPNIDLIYTNALPVTNTIYKELSKYKQVYASQPQPHWKMTLPDSLEDALQSKGKRIREQIRRSMRKIEKIQPPYSFRVYQSEKDVQEFYHIAKTISDKTYQSAIDVGFPSDPEHYNHLELSAQKGWFRSCIICLGETPVAFQEGLVYRDVYYMPYLGYDQKLRDFNLGTVLMVNSWDDLCKNKLAKLFDFGYGDGEYKKRYSDICEMEGQLFLYKKKANIVITIFLKRIVEFLNNTIRHYLRNVGLYDKIKTKWRKYKASQRSPN